MLDSVRDASHRIGMKLKSMKTSRERSEAGVDKLSNSRPVSVCHVVAADVWAGAEAQVAMLLAKLAGNPELRLRVIALGEGRLVQELSAANVEVNVVPNPQRRFSFCYRESHRFLRQKQIDVLHSHKSKEHVLAWLLARRMGIPHVIQTQHGMAEPKTLKDRLVYGLARRTAKSANQVISVSADLAHQLQRYIEPNKIAVVPNAIDVQQVRSRLSREAAKRSLGISEHVPVIGTAARLEPVKRIDLFLAVAQHLSAKCSCAGLPEPFFLIAGDGSDRSRLQQVIEGTALRNRVAFLGHRDDVYDIIRAMDLLLITSDHEGMPTLVLEAMALGTAVVSRKVGGVPEIIDEGVDGVLVDKSDPLSIARGCLTVLTSPDLARRLAEAARQKVVGKFSADANASRLLQIYRSLPARAEADKTFADALECRGACEQLISRSESRFMTVPQKLELTEERTPLVSVIIPTLNEEKVIGECIASLARQQWPRDAFEVIVVDNGSVDGTVAAARHFIARLNLTVQVLPGCHISELRNAGAREARGKVLAFLDSDCVAPENWLELATSIVRDADDLITGSFYTIPKNSGWLARAWYGDMTRERSGPVSYVPSGTLFISRRGFWDLGGFDADLETSEDFELCQRAKAAGYKVVAYPELSTVHLGTPQTLSAFWRKERWHGSGVREVLFGHSSQRGFGNTLLLTLYSILCLTLTLLGIPVALVAGKAAFLAVGPALLVGAAAVMAARSSIHRGRWRYFLPVTVLYVVYGVARSLTLLGLSGRSPRRVSGRSQRRVEDAAESLSTDATKAGRSQALQSRQGF